MVDVLTVVVGVGVVVVPPGPDAVAVNIASHTDNIIIISTICNLLLFVLVKCPFNSSFIYRVFHNDIYPPSGLYGVL